MPLDKVISSSIANGAVGASAISNTANVTIGTLAAGNTTVTGFANVTGTLAAGNTTVTGFANVTGTLAAGNTTVTGSVTVTEKIQIGSEPSSYGLTVKDSSAATRAYIVNGNSATSGVYFVSKNASNTALAAATLRVTNTGIFEVYNGLTGAEKNPLNIYANGTASFSNNTITDFKILGYLTNKIEPLSGGYGGLTFQSSGADSDGGYLLYRDGADADVYQQYGVTLVTDRGPLTFAARGSTIGASSTRNFIRFMTNSGSNATTRMTISRDGYVTLANQPRFHAYGISGGTYATGSYVIFPTTLSNIGSHYNASNGVFTAPVAGTYHFYWGSIGNNGTDVYRLYVRKNNVDLNGYHLRVDTSLSGNEYGTNGSAVITADLAANDTIRIYFTSDSGNSLYPAANSPTDSYMMFGGYLIG